MRMTMIRLTPTPCVQSARRWTRWRLHETITWHVDLGRRWCENGSDPYARSVGQHQLPAYRATRANFRVSSGVWNVILMTAGPNTNPTECNREKLVNALEEALIKQLEVAIYSNEIWEKALDVVCKRIASGEVSDNMLLHIVLSLSKSTAVVLSCTAERRRS